MQKSTNGRLFGLFVFKLYEKLSVAKRRGLNMSKYIGVNLLKEILKASPACTRNGDMMGIFEDTPNAAVILDYLL